MDIQQHARTKQIMKLSQVLYRLLTWFRVVLYLGGLAILLVAVFISEGSLVIGDQNIEFNQHTPEVKLLVLILFSCALMLFIRLNNHFRGLMQHFMVGDIFSQEAIAQVRSALLTGLWLLALHLIQISVAGYFSHDDKPGLVWSLGSTTIVALLFFGLMYTLLWALEIGSDLNEESEMTI